MSDDENLYYSGEDNELIVCVECDAAARYKVHHSGWFCDGCVPRCKCCSTPDDYGEVCETCINELCEEAEKNGVPTDAKEEILVEWILKNKCSSA
jgi:hypothetical protein